MKKILGILALTFLTLLGVAPAAMAAPPTDIVVEDTAGVLYQPQLLPALEKINFHQPTKVVIYTRNGSSSDNLNEEVLRYAKANHPEWISSDGQKWADGLFILAVDPAGRQVGSYMGEDRKVSLSKQEAIQEATKDQFREAQWTDGTIAGVKKAAKLINQPWYLSAAFIITTSIVGGLAALGLGTRAVVRASNRKKAAANLKRGDAGFANVSLDLPVTELNAKTIPAESTYGGLVLEKYRNFMTRYNQAAGLNEKSHAFTAKELSKATNVSVTAQYADLAEELDALDNVIADTNTLLNKYSGWETAWDRQARPLVEDLNQLPALLSRKEARNVPTTSALESFRAQKGVELANLAAAFHAGQMSPETALDQLKSIREQLTALLVQHSEAMIGQYAKTSTEEKAMRSAMAANRNKVSAGRQDTILGTAYGWSMYYSVIAFNSGYSSARSSVDSSRSSASSGGSSSGYGSSGGSFSGSGSSSSF